MHRFAGRALKLLVPAGLALYTIRPVFSQQQPKEDPKVQHNSLFLGLQGIGSSIKEVSEQKAEEKNEADQQKQQETHKEQTQLSSKGEQRKSQPQNIPKHEPTSNPQQAYAQISPSTPKFIQDYLKMQGVTVKLDPNLQSPSNTETITIKIANKIGDTTQFTLRSQNVEQNRHILFHIGNFVTPLRVITTKEQLSELFKGLPTDQYLIVAFVPTEQEYLLSKMSRSEYDSFTGMEKLDVKKLQEQYKRLRYESVSAKSNYVLIRDPQIAHAAKINTNKIGFRYIYYKTTPNQGMEASTLLQGMKFTIKTVPLNAPADKDILSKGLYSYINQINYQGDLQNFIRSLELKKQSKKLLIIYSKEKRPEFVKEVKGIALKAAKMLRQQVIVLMTENPKLLSQYFQIIPDDFVTIRLLDLNRIQPSLLALAGIRKSGKKFYSRKVMTGPFTVENLCRFIKTKQPWKQYYQSIKNLPTIPSIVSQNEPMGQNTAVLYWKHGCKGCELTSNYLQHIKRVIESLDQQKIIEYQIQKPHLLKHLQFRKLNILNQSHPSNPKDHDVTPKLILYNSKGKRKDLNIGEILGKIAGVMVKDEEKVHMSIIRDIIDRICGEVQQINDGS